MPAEDVDEHASDDEEMLATGVIPREQVTQEGIVNEVRPPSLSLSRVTGVWTPAFPATCMQTLTFSFISTGSHCMVCIVAMRISMIGMDGLQEGLLRALESFEQVTLPWPERLDVTSADPLNVPDANDDLERELQLCVEG